MQITDLTINPRLIIEQIRSQGLELLRTGQVVQASVIEPTKQGVAKLSIGGTEVLARTQVSLSAGERWRATDSGCCQSRQTAGTAADQGTNHQATPGSSPTGIAATPGTTT